ncbi:MAG: diguanylate cyclase [Lachnospiraceae bacterium]|nr:diguanylate cyclase [Lachnospiraceae bacterium]
MEKQKNLSTHAVLLPIIIILALLNVGEVYLIQAVNRESSSLSKAMQVNNDHITEATSLLAGTSLLAETSGNFVIVPVTGNGELNISPLIAYSEEIVKDRRGDQILERFQEYEVGEKALALLSDAVESSNYMLEAQAHAIALMREIYPLPDIPPLAALPSYELSEEELAASEEEKAAAARMLLWGTDYGANKQNVSQSVNACVEMMQRDFSSIAAKTNQHLEALKRMLWLVTLSNIVIISSTFVMLYLQLVMPLDSFVKLIDSGKPLNDKNGLEEVNLLASAYNDLLRRRDNLDDILRSAAKTDPLTNLPNRYGYEQYLLSLENSKASMAVFLFDVNYLKRTNDREGHIAGDKLLKAAAESITACFLLDGEENCFRYGGDEFTAVIKDASEDELKERIGRFEEEQKKRNISISWGYAFTETLQDTSFKALQEEADKRMYEQKELTHAGRTD